MPKRQISRAELIFEELLSLALAKNDFTLLDECMWFLNPDQKEMLRILASGKRKSDDPAMDAAIDLVVLREPPQISDANVAEIEGRTRERIL